MEQTEIAVEHPKFDGYSYKFKILWETECQAFKVFKSGKEKCLERWTFSKQKLMYDWINLKTSLYNKDLESWDLEISERRGCRLVVPDRIQKQRR